MKIKTAIADSPLNLPKAAGSLKPLSGADFHGALDAAVSQSGTPATASPGPATPLAPLDETSISSHPTLRPLASDPMVPGFKGQPKPLDRLEPAPPPPLVPLDDADSEFSPGLPQRHPEKTPHDKVVETARKLVAQTFYGTMLKQMRNSPFKSELFEGGRGGQAFSPMLDQKLAEHMARSADSGLVNAIARKLEGAAAYQQHTAEAKKLARQTPQNVRAHVAPSLRA